MGRGWKTRAADKVLIKKYGNRRLYDTHHSRYVTLSEVAELVHAGSSVRVIDAKSNEDLTRGTLVQILFDGRGAGQLLPADLLMALVRMDDDALAEFLGRYTAFALEIYQQINHGGPAVAPWNPLAATPLAAGIAGTDEGPPADEASSEVVPGPIRATSAEVGEIRRELADLKATLAELVAKK